MTTIQRSALPSVELLCELVEVPELGGAVRVRGMDLPQLLRFNVARRRLAQPLDGETERDTGERAGAEIVPVLLAMCAVLDDGEPVYTQAQWAAFAAKHTDAALRLFECAIALSGQDEAAEKKT